MPGRADSIQPRNWLLVGTSSSITATVGIGRCWPCSGPKISHRTNTPVQTVHADFPHTAYQWSVGSQHYAGLLLPGGLPG
jgi:hypothetical protein